MPNLNVTYDELQSVAGQIDAGRDQLASQLQHLQSVVDNLVASGFQTDQASEAYRSQFTQYVTSTRTAIDSLEGYSQFLRAAATAMSDTDSALANQMRG